MDRKLSQMDHTQYCVKGLTARVDGIDLKITGLENKIHGMEQSCEFEGNKTDELSKSQKDLESLINKMKTYEQKQGARES